MSKKSFLENIEVKTPCSEDWKEMRGSDEARFCSHCSKSVNNLSAVTRRKARKIVKESNGNICVRYVKNPVSNAPLFAEDFIQIAHHRAPRLAVGIVTAALSFSSMAYAQEGINPTRAANEISQNKVSEKDKTVSAMARLYGTILDTTGAVIPGISVSLLNELTGETQKLMSNDEGFYEFKDLDTGTYKLEAEAALGFRSYIIEQIKITGSENSKIDVEMSPGFEAVVMGAVSIVSYGNPLFNAVSESNLEEVKNLIALGENINEKDENHRNITPLFLAIENGSTEIAETLLGFGARANARDENKQTPLMQLDEDAEPELVRILIKHGAKINLTDKEGNSALMFAAGEVKPEVLQILLDHRAEVNARNKKGQTALMNAADEDNLENVRALILAGADVNLKNEDGETAWDLTSNAEIEELLESFGAKVKKDDESEPENNQ